MNDKTKKYINVILNIIIFLTIIGVTYSWMLTEPSVGELVDYDKELIIMDSDIEVDVYAYIDNDYVEQTISPMYLGLIAPGMYQRYRFDITNAKDYPANTKMVLVDITGDTLDLANHVIFGTTSPSMTSFTLGEKIMYNEVEERYYLDFLESIIIPANSTLSLYCYITIDEEAENEIIDMELEIQNILFMNP